MYTKKPFFYSLKKGLAGSVLALAVLAAPVQNAWAEASEKNNSALLEIYNTLIDAHYEKPSEEELLQGAIQGMLDVIHDPYTNYMSPSAYEDFKNGINLEYAGIGVRFTYAEDESGLIVDEVFTGSPAEESGILNGDIVVQVDQTPVTPDNIRTITSQIRGEAGTEVTLLLVREGEQLQKKVARKAIELPEVTTEDMGNGIAYIQIVTFGERTTEEFLAAYHQAEAANAKGLILDLRGNSGGYVLSALEIADHFLKKGELLVLHNSEGGEDVYVADELGTDIPLVVLIDRNTASASEMLAGALKTNGRATLVGETSFGKGTMQTAFELSNGGTLKVSVDNWLLPDRSNIHDIGLLPDIYLQRSEAVVNAAVQQLLPDRKQTLELSLKEQTGVLNENIFLTGVPAIHKDSQSGEYYVPMRYVMESFGTEVVWNNETKRTSFIYRGQQVEIDSKSWNLIVNGKSVPLNQPLKSIAGTIYMSTDAVKSVTGGSVSVSADALLLNSRP
ncbi:S41 family peptidase [Marinicrinis lubricantis]|uniref:S41 family peptidase n=1 Tax=Marinicrinis lubricantis TaxID=2086470 RepID=A0ABW1IRA3_9BACL